MAKDILAYSLAGGLTTIAAATTIPVNPEPGLLGIYYRVLTVGASLALGGASLSGTNDGYVLASTAAHKYVDMVIGGTFWILSGTGANITYMKLYGNGSVGAQG